jgi:hypothetical protein
MHRVRARATCEGRWGESTVNVSGSKLKFLQKKNGALENLLLFPSGGREARESAYLRRKVKKY